MTITKLSPSDWPIFKSLWLEALQNEPTAYYSNFAEKSSAPDTEWQDKLFETHDRYYFALENGAAIGLAGYFVSPRVKTNHVAEIVRVYVSPKYRRHGLGKKLLTHVLSDIRHHPEIRKIRIEVMATQAAAISLYQSLGFHEVGRFEQELHVENGYYDEILMEKMLK
jgi:ribosomal protein S18 acetylase RimI-like enzyme